MTYLKFKQLFTAIAAPLRGRETRGVSFIQLNAFEARLSLDIKQQQPWNRHHSKDRNGVSGCICLCKQYVYANAGWPTLIEDVNDTLCDRTRAPRWDSVELDSRDYFNNFSPQMIGLHIQSLILMKYVWWFYIFLPLIPSIIQKLKIYIVITAYFFHSVLPNENQTDQPVNTVV